MKTKKKTVKIQLKDEGFDIYSPREGQTWGYRYGPSIMTYPDKSADAWFASPGAAEEADWFTWRHSSDGGKTWSDEKVVLTPTPDSMDFFSVCDPGVIRFGGWYYIGYTSTIYPERGGVCNNAFVARSKNPDGPFEKWTGDGWGSLRHVESGDLSWVGKPAPIVYFSGSKDCWGIGELSFVVLKDILYIYYTITSTLSDGTFFSETRVAIADATVENWPKTIKQRGVAAVRASGSNDSFDVVYCEDYKKFIAISTDRRFTKESMLAFYESNDGLTFTRACELRTNTGCCCHNSGISGDEYHHIKKGDLLLLGYAYGSQWGFWGTRFHEYDFELVDSPYSEKDAPNIDRAVLPSPSENLKPMAITTLPHFYRCRVGESARVECVSLDSTYKAVPVGEEDITIDNFDPTIAAFDGLSFTGVGVGYTFVDAEAFGHRVQFLIYVYPEDFDFEPEHRTSVSLEPVAETFRIYLSHPDALQLRCLCQYDDGKWGEAFGAKDNIFYSEYNEKLISVDENGFVRAKGKKGTTDIAVTLGGFRVVYRIKIKKGGL